MPHRTTSTGKVYFATMSIIDWISVFIRRQYFDLLVENLQYCQNNKGLEIFSYCIMPNHIHLIAAGKHKPLNLILGDFKEYTAKKMIAMIEEDARESRKIWMLRSFNWHGQRKSNNLKYQFWKHGNYPVLLYSHKVFKQKEQYIHDNPVRVGFVSQAEHWVYSSANPESPIDVIR